MCALETLGGDTGFLASRIGSSGGADILLVPEEPVPPDALEAVTRSAMNAQGFAVIVASEGYPDLERVLKDLEARVGVRLRFSRPSHSMRGGKPSAHDRMLARSLAIAGVDALARGQSGLIAWRSGQPSLVPFKEIPETKPFTRE